MSKAQKRPFMFADTGIPSLFEAAYQLGAKKARMRVLVVGGAQIMDQQGLFNIGKRNYAALRELFLRDNIKIDHEEVGGNVNRTLKLSVKTGQSWVKISGKGELEV
jgi:chemotaxis protein CheD